MSGFVGKNLEGQSRSGILVVRHNEDNATERHKKPSEYLKNTIIFVH